MKTASLDHAMWFHRPTDFNEWHLYHQESPSASGGRGFNLGYIYRASDGALSDDSAFAHLLTENLLYLDRLSPREGGKARVLSSPAR